MSSGGRVFPSVTGGGFTRATQAILDAELAGAERELRSRQLDIQSRQLDITERAGALNQMVTLAGFLEPGTTLGMLGAGGMDLFGRAFDMDVTGLEDLELKPETLATAIDARGRDFLESEEGEALLLPSVRAQLGLEPSGVVADLQDLEAEMRIGALNEIQRNPAMTREFVNRALGRQPITLRIPGADGESDTTVSFDSELAARIYSQFLLNREEFGYRILLEGENPAEELIADVQEAVAAAGLGFSISPPAVRRVIGIYNQAASANSNDAILQFINDPRVTEGEKLALEYLLGSIGVGEQIFLENLDPRIANYYRMQRLIGQDTDPEQTIELLKSITGLSSPSFIAQLTDPFIGGLRLELGGDAPPPPGGAGGAGGAGPGGGTNFSQIATDEDIQEAFRLGDTRESLAQVVGMERVNAALGEVVPLDSDIRDAATIPEGGMNPSAVPIPLRRDVQRLNALVRRLETTRGEAAVRNLSHAIERLRERIRAGVSGG